MALINQQQSFDPDRLPAPVLGIAAELMHHDSGLHQHRCAQLLYAPCGCMTVTLADRWLILPPTRSVWIPGGIAHRVQLRGRVAYRSLFLTHEPAAALPLHCAVLMVNPLLAAIIERMAHWPLDYALENTQARDLLQVLLNELMAARQEAMQLALPQDGRLSGWLAQLPEQDALPGLARLALNLHLHSKTLTRIFQRDTGLSYRQWCQQWRLMRSIELLAELPSVSAVAQRMAFSSDSAFIAFFRQFTGTTPKRYMQGTPTK